MGDEPNTTTVEIKTETWAALDRRKERGQSFDDVIQRLINNSAVSMGDLSVGEVPDIDMGDLVEYDGAGDCAYYDIVTGNMCDNEIAYREEWKHPHEDEWSHWYWCEDHKPKHSE